jgi:hypothetical protein
MFATPFIFAVEVIDENHHYVCQTCPYIYRIQTRVSTRHQFTSAAFLSWHSLFAAQSQENTFLTLMLSLSLAACETSLFEQETGRRRLGWRRGLEKRAKDPNHLSRLRQ